MNDWHNEAHRRPHKIVYQTPHHLWLCVVRGCRRTATELFRSPPLEFGTVCHTTSRLHSHCLFSVVVWRLIFSDAVFLDYSVLPAKWHLSLWTHLSFLLTYIPLRTNGQLTDWGSPGRWPLHLYRTCTSECIMQNSYDWPVKVFKIRLAKMQVTKIWHQYSNIRKSSHKCSLTH